MPALRVSAEVYEKLQSLARPFSDTPDSVLRRLLQLKGGTRVIREDQWAECRRNLVEGIKKRTGEQSIESETLTGQYNIVCRCDSCIRTPRWHKRTVCWLHPQVGLMWAEVKADLATKAGVDGLGEIKPGQAFPGGDAYRFDIKSETSQPGHDSYEKVLDVLEKVWHSLHED